MKLIDRYTFTNGKAFETWYLDAADLAQRGLPECDVIGLRRISDNHDRMLHLRPDEALIMSRLLVGVVLEISEGYKVGPPVESASYEPPTPDYPTWQKHGD